MTGRVSTAVSAPIRTGAQYVAAFAVVEFIAAFLMEMSERQHDAAVGLAIVVVTVAQHLVENRTGKAVLRDVPPTTSAVVDGGYSLVELMVAAFFAVLTVAVLLAIF